MPDSAVNDDSLGTFLLDGEMPRLGEPPKPIVPEPVALSVVADASSFAPPPPGSAPLLRSEEPTLPMPTLASPVLPGSVQVPGTDALAGLDDGASGAPAAGAHPMAQLMGEKTQQQESSMRAAQIRAEMKARARKKKIIALVVILAAIAAGGPPLVMWLTDAINEAGKTKPDEPPATTVVRDEDDDTPATTVDDSAPSGLAGLPDQARDAVDRTNGQADTSDAP